MAAAGSVDHERLVELCQRMAAEEGDAARAASPRAAPAARRAAAAVHSSSSARTPSSTTSASGARRIARSDRRRFTASILDSILGGSASSRLFQEIREKRGLAYAVYTFASLYADTGQIGVYVGTREENLAHVPGDRRAPDRRHLAGGASARRSCQRAKENLKGRIMLSMESTSNRMSRLGKSLITDCELLSLDRILAEIEAVDADGVAAARRDAARARAALGRGDRAERGALPGARRARQPRTSSSAAAA